MSQDIHGQLHLVNALGMRISVDFAGEQDAFATMRALGRAGWAPLEIPSGGLKLPLALHDKFDWSLIGAYPLTIDDEQGVMFQGQFYKQRVYEEQTKGKKMPAAIKYSRGAKPTDPPHLVEGDEKSSFKYVTLISFRGNGRSIAQFEIPSNGQQSRSAQQPDAQPATSTAGETDVLATHIDNIGRIIKERGFAETDVRRLVRDVTHGKTNDYTKITAVSEAAQVRTRLANARKAS